MIKRWKDDKFRAKVIKGMFWAWKLHYLISLRSRAHVNVSTCLEHMDVRAGLNEYWKSKEGVAERERRSKDAYLAPRRAGGFGDGDKISDGASRRSEALVDIFITINLA